MKNRRKFLIDSLSTGLALNLPAVTFGAMGSIGHNTDVLRRIAFGSCCKSWKPQGVWRSILEHSPDLFLFLGDTIYADEKAVETAGIVHAFRDAYQDLSRRKEFQQFRKRVPIMSTWDDHDYGPRESGADFEEKESTRRLFLDFWGLASEDGRRTQSGGIYTASEYGPPEKRTQIIILDTRFGRSPLLTASPGEDKLSRLSGFGPYRPDYSLEARLLLDRQWIWLEGQLSRPARLRIVCSSIPFAAGFRGWESWSNFPLERARLIRLIAKTRAGGVIFLSGDIHYGDLSCETLNVPYPLWDLTSSGLTHFWPSPGPNSNRVYPQTVNTINFGLVHVLWDVPGPVVVLEVRDAKGELRLQRSILLDSLKFA